MKLIKYLQKWIVIKGVTLFTNTMISKITVVWILHNISLEKLGKRWKVISQ